MKKTIISAALGVAAFGLAVTGATAGTLDDVKAKGHIQCGVSQGVPGVSNPDEKGN